MARAAGCSHAESALGPGDSLSHCGFGLQQRPGDLGHGEPGDQAQGQRQLRRPVQCGVGTGEHHPQLVIADRMRNARAVGAGANVVDHGGQFLPRTDRLAAQSVQRAVARDRDDPSAWVVRDAVARPGPQRLGEGFLDSVLCDGEVAPTTARARRQRPPIRAEERCPGWPFGVRTRRRRPAVAAPPSSPGSSRPP